MKKLLNQKEQHYADTREEAEEIVMEAKDNDALVMNKISEKYNKYGQYFLVDLTYQYGTPKEVMEGKKPESENAPDGQLSIEEVEQQEEEFDPDSIQFEEEPEDETPRPQATESDLPF